MGGFLTDDYSNEQFNGSAFASRVTNTVRTEVKRIGAEQIDPTVGQRKHPDYKTAFDKDEKHKIRHSLGTDHAGQPLQKIPT